MVKLFKPEEEKKIIAAIQAAELLTSSEIRVHVDQVDKLPVVDAAWIAFKKLKMDQTKDRNGVLFLLLPHRREYAVIGDEGIHAKVGQNFWQVVKDEVHQHFILGEFGDGLVAGISMVGQKLHQYFPYTHDDKNELSDDISYAE